MSEQFTLTTAGGASINLIDPANGFNIIEVSYPVPDVNVLYAMSIDTDGGQGVAAAYQNRRIPVKVRVSDVTSGDGKMDAGLKKLQQVVARVFAEGGTVTRVTSSGTINFDAVRGGATLEVPSDQLAVVGRNALCSLNLECLPLGYGTEGSVASWGETTLPVLRGTVGNIAGDWKAKTRLVVNNDSASDQLWMQWGVRSKNYGTATSNALFYEAETRLLQGGAFLAARSGASGGTVARQGTLTTDYQSMMSLASSGTAYLSHVGNLQVMARVYDPGGTAGATSGGTVGNVKLALEWAPGDFLRVTRNDAVSPAVINNFSIVDLGQVNIPKVASGTQRWDGRIIAKSVNAGDAVDVDCVWFVPVDEGSGRALASPLPQAPTGYSVRDEFNQTSGTVTGKTLPVGGTYTGAGDADDWSMDTTNHRAQRTATSDTANTGRWEVASTPTLTGCAVQADLGTGASTPIGLSSGSRLFAIARYTDTNNWLGAGWLFDHPSQQLPTWSVVKRVSGTITSLFNSSSVALVGASVETLKARVQLVVDVSGTWRLYAALSDNYTGSLSLIATGQDASLATGGALASGKVGFYDEAIASSGYQTRTIDNLLAWSIVTDAAAFANQSLELRSDQISREDASGTLWGPVTKYEGDYPTAPQSGQENRTSEFIIKLSRGDPTSMGDSGIDDLSAQLYVTPRWLNVPES